MQNLSIRGGKTINKKIVALIMIIIFVCTLPFLFYHNKSDYTSTFFSLDTIVSIKTDSNIADTLKSEIQKFDTIYDIYSENSEIYKLNEKKQLVCSNELTDMIKKTILAQSIYGNRLDITIGNVTKLWNCSIDNGALPDNSLIMRYLNKSGYENIDIKDNLITLKNEISLDAGSVAKGYVLDHVSDIVKKSDAEYAIISLGSSTLLYSDDEQRSFNVMIKADKDSIAGTVSTGPCFVSTSGDYERCVKLENISYHHILDNLTGYPADSGLSSVTVFCDNGLISDFLSTLIFIEGKENLQKHLNTDEYSIVAIDSQGKIYKSENLKFSS